uniref:Uncharacterized protein n=1 Tax=Spongospora subterranea TaxID=70186 RepID=A0A0H5R2H5_9EUKA|eukprot:CRZ08161.1 hypothetical protein [Spongospora subterranea]
MKMKAKLIIEALRPEAVRRMATNALKFNHREARKDCRKLFDVLLRIVTNQDEVHRASRPHGGERHIKGDQEKQDKKSNGHEPARVTNREASNNVTSKYWKDSWKPRTEKPTDGCLKCGGGHWLSECQQRITKEEREKLIAEFKNKKELGKVETRAKEVTRREEEETVGVFGQGCQYPTQLDSGADRTYIPGSLLKEIQSKNPKVQLVHQVIKGSVRGETGQL